MRVLFILKEPLKIDIIRNALTEFAENDSIYFVNSYEEATNYINKEIIGNQQPLDLIISEKEFESFGSTEFIRNITSSNEIYSNLDFHISYIPTILLVPQSENLSFYERKGFSAVTRDFEEDNISKNLTLFRNEVKKWRRQVVDELDNLGIKYNSGVIDYTNYVNKRKRNIDTNILSNNFKHFPRKLNYYWLENNSKQIELDIDEYLKLLKRTHPGNKKREEKLYHKFFNTNGFFLKRDRYSQSWYEQKLHYTARRYYEPDYSLKTNMNFETDLNILEVKLPNEAFTKSKSFHPTLLSRIFNHLSQINDYKDYLENEQFDEIIRKRYGWKPEKISYQLLVGRQYDKEENLSIIEKRMRQFGQTGVDLITYDELLKYQVKFLYRIGFLEIN